MDVSDMRGRVDELTSLLLPIFLKERIPPFTVDAESN
jgi:hypothetical protein